jgi:hypothetical protein
MFYVSYESGCWLMMLHNDDEEEGIAELTQKLQGGDGDRGGDGGGDGGGDDFGRLYKLSVNPGCAEEQQEYLCSTNDKGGPGTQPSLTMPLPRALAPATSDKATMTAGAVPGEYVITYSVIDSSGLRECWPVKRTVVVLGKEQKQKPKRDVAGVEESEEVNGVVIPRSQTQAAPLDRQQLLQQEKQVEKQLRKVGGGSLSSLDLQKQLQLVKALLGPTHSLRDGVRTVAHGRHMRLSTTPWVPVPNQHALIALAPADTAALVGGAFVVAAAAAAAVGVMVLVTACKEPRATSHTRPLQSYRSSSM